MLEIVLLGILAIVMTAVILYIMTTSASANQHSSLSSSNSTRRCSINFPHLNLPAPTKDPEILQLHDTVNQLQQQLAAQQNTSSSCASGMPYYPQSMLPDPVMYAYPYSGGYNWLSGGLTVTDTQPQQISVSNHNVNKICTSSFPSSASSPRFSYRKHHRQVSPPSPCPTRKCQMTPSPSPTRGVFPSPSPTRGVFPSPSPTRGVLPSPSPTRGVLPSPSPTRGVLPSPSPSA